MSKKLSLFKEISKIFSKNLQIFHKVNEKRFFFGIVIKKFLTQKFDRKFCQKLKAKNLKTEFKNKMRF